MFDDGRMFDLIKVGDDDIYLYFFIEFDNIGCVFLLYVLGLVLGNGNIGKNFGKFFEFNLFVLNNVGVSWKKVFDGFYKYEFGDFGFILVVVKDIDKGDVKEIEYLINYGEDWEFVKFLDDFEIQFMWLIII